MPYKIFIISLVIFGLILFSAAAFLIALLLNPMPLVKRMRKGDTAFDGNLSYPPYYKERIKNITVISDLEYPSKYHNAFYDLYYPKDSKEKNAVILWIHGGSFVAGTRYGIVNVASMLASYGYTVIAADYAFVPEAKHPSAVIQMSELYSHLCNINHPNIDTENIFIAGDSAGAQIASEFTAVETNDELSKKMGIKQVIPKNALRGAILTCGPYDLAGIRKAKNIILRYGLWILGRHMFSGRPWHKSESCLQSTTKNHITENYPPTYITDGNTFSFEAQGRALGEALRSKGVPVTERYFDIKDGKVPHEYLFNLADDNARLCFQDILSFLDKYK